MAAVPMLAGGRRTRVEICDVTIDSSLALIYLQPSELHRAAEKVSRTLVTSRRISKPIDRLWHVFNTNRELRCAVGSPVTDVATWSMDAHHSKASRGRPYLGKTCYNTPTDASSCLSMMRCLGYWESVHDQALFRIVFGADRSPEHSLTYRHPKEVNRVRVIKSLNA